MEQTAQLMYQIKNSEDIAVHRARLLKQLRSEEKRLYSDSRDISKRIERFSSWGTTIGNVISFAAPKLNLLGMGFSLLSRLWKRKKR